MIRYYGSPLTKPGETGPQFQKRRQRVNRKNRRLLRMIKKRKSPRHGGKRV